MKYFKCYKHARVAPANDWEDIFELLSGVDSPEVGEWLDRRSQSGFTVEEFVTFLQGIDRDEVQDWLWVHREEFVAVLSRPTFNFDGSQPADGQHRWHQMFFPPPRGPGDATE